MVITKQSLLKEVAERAHQLLSAGRALGHRVKVSRREREVLEGVLQSLANKEIASRLNVSERTVKFHVSSLLAKFGVTDRFALSREASLSSMPPGASGEITSDKLFGYAIGPSEANDKKSAAANTSSRAADKSRARGRVFPIFPNQRFAT